MALSRMAGPPPARARVLARVAVASVLLGALAGVALAQDDAPLLTPRLVLWRYADASAFEQPRGIAFDPLDGAIYVANSGKHRIEVFSRTGRALSQFVHRVTGPEGNRIDGTPCALAFDHQGRLLVADLRSHSVDVLDRRGRSLWTLPATTGQPNALAVAADGTIYVGTTAQESKVHRFRPDYRADGAWGVQGSERGQLWGVTALCVLNDGSVAVGCDRTELGVQIFSAAGEYLRGFGTHEVGEGNLSMPSGLVATPDGRIWVVDEIRQTIQVFDSQGNALSKEGQRGAGAGEFAHPSSMTYDGRNSIALTDREIGRVQVFTVSDLSSNP
jgi:DNA-binding beta-propeller fold protein YncE